jgi:hypothetical protein
LKHDEGRLKRNETFLFRRPLSFYKTDK